MLIDCPYCKSKVKASVEGEREHFDPREDQFPYRVQVGGCPSCHQTLVGVSEQVPTEDDFGDVEDIWSAVTRVWPLPKRVLAWHVPEIVKTSVDEADRCFQSGAFTASVVMCGRALEGVCVDKGIKATLQAGLQELVKQKIIDQRLYEWGEELRKVRNLGAHATPEKVSREDASDVLDFLHAIADYIYVLNRKFEEFRLRRAAKPS